MPDNLNLFIEHSVKLLQQQNSAEGLGMIIGVEILFWLFIVGILMLSLPKRYKPYRQDIFIFFFVINIGLLFMGILLTLLMMMFGLSWATHRASQPNYEHVEFADHIADFPLVHSHFQEGILTMEDEDKAKISSDKKIKSLKILYESNAQNNIGQIKEFLSDASDETRLYAFALISTFEKKLNTQIQDLQYKIENSPIAIKVETYRFELALTYWQFIFHGVTSHELAGFYTQKIEVILKELQANASASVLLGKIKIFHHKYNEAEKHFNHAIELGMPKEALATYFAEITYEQKRFNEVEQYVLKEQFEIDIRLKPLVKIWISA